MKKTIIIMFMALILISIILVFAIRNRQLQNREIVNKNSEYEYLLEKEILGNEVATIINKAINSNEKNNIPKKEDGTYIPDKEHSVKVELNMISVEKTYQMEQIFKSGINNFIKHFGLIKFKCTKMEYHETTKLVSKIIFEQIEE